MSNVTHEWWAMAVHTNKSKNILSPLEFPQKSDKINLMAQKNPPGQNDFLATALERELLARISEDGTLTAEEIVGNLPHPAAARNALDGCLAKHFVAQDAAGHLVLTESGRKQV
ncbi:MAG: hypothetical protein HDR36_02215 [Treponema sp.]|nr:hypothetical protein [Treponema sp.]